MLDCWFCNIRCRGPQNSSSPADIPATVAAAPLLAGAAPLCAGAAARFRGPDVQRWVRASQQPPSWHVRQRGLAFANPATPAHVRRRVAHIPAATHAAERRLRIRLRPSASGLTASAGRRSSSRLPSPVGIRRGLRRPHHTLPS